MASLTPVSSAYSQPWVFKVGVDESESLNDLRMGAEIASKGRLGPEHAGVADTGWESCFLARKVVVSHRLLEEHNQGCCVTHVQADELAYTSSDCIWLAFS